MNQNTKIQLLLYVAFALLEATPAVMVMTLLAVPAALPVFILLALLAAMAELLIEARVPAPQQRYGRVLIALLLAIGAVSTFVGGPDKLQAILSHPNENSSLAYVGLLTSLYIVWRGTRLPAVIDEDAREVFGRIMLTVLGVLFLGLLGGTFSNALLATFVTSEIVLCFAVGLVLVALVRQREAAPEMQRIRGWHNIAPVLGATMLIIVLSLGLLGFLGANAADLLNRIIINILLLIFTIVGPVLEIILGGLIWILERIHLPEMLDRLQMLAAGLAQRTQQQQNDLSAVERDYPWLSAAIRALELGLPVLVILALIWFLTQRRRARTAVINEERESLFSWQGFANDILDLLGRLRRPASGDSLEGALARLQGDSASIRIRRSYLKMLIAAKQRTAPRSASTTPREYQPQALGVFPNAASALQTLTTHYERARYHSDSATLEQAQEAEKALGEVRSGE